MVQTILFMIPNNEAVLRSCCSPTKAEKGFMDSFDTQMWKEVAYTYRSPCVSIGYEQSGLYLFPVFLRNYEVDIGIIRDGPEASLVFIVF